MIIFTLRRQAGLLRNRWIMRVEPHFLWAMQFLLGGLLSSYVVFYFKSVSWTQTQFFFILLVALLIGNEFLHHRLGNPLLLATLFFFCAFSYFAFFLPVVLARVGTGMFLVSGSAELRAGDPGVCAGFPGPDSGLVSQNGPRGGLCRRSRTCC